MATASLLVFRFARSAGVRIGSVGILSFAVLGLLAFAGWLPLPITGPTPDVSLPDPFRWGSRS